MSNEKVNSIVAKYKLIPHPEGGFFAETHRSTFTLTRPADGAIRSAATSILYLLPAGKRSALHRIKSTELWYYHGGGSLTVFELKEDGQVVKTVLGSGKNEVVFHTVEAGVYFGASVPTDDSEGYALVSCVVAPGFDFQDWDMPSSQELRDGVKGDGEVRDKIIRTMSKDALMDANPFE